MGHITCTSSNDLVYSDTHQYLQNGDSAVINARVEYRSGVLWQLVDAGTDLNLQNEVRLEITMHSALHHVYSLAVYIRRV